MTMNAFAKALLVLLLMTSFIPLSAQEEKADDDTATETEFGSGRKSEPKSKTSKRKKATKSTKEEDDAKDSDKSADEKPDDDKPVSNEGGEEFGSGRRKTTVKKLDEAELAADKDKARYVKTLRKQFKEEKAHYVILTREQGYEADKSSPDGYQPFDKIEFEVLHGQDDAVAFVVDYMSKYSKPWAKKTKASSKKTKDENAKGPPDPVRGWEPLEMFATADEAESYREAREQALEAERKAAEELQKPRR